jgi:hypothetical protein
MPPGIHRPPKPEVTVHHKDDRVMNFTANDPFVRILLTIIALILLLLFLHGHGWAQASPTSAQMFYYNPSTGKWTAVSATNPLPVSTSGSGSNACASATGSAVPASACYSGLNIAGDLVGQTGFSVGSQNAAAVAIVDGSGNQITSFGGGTQYAQGTTQATPTGTVALGQNPSNILNALALDASGNLKVNLNANSFGTFTVTGAGGTFPATQSGTWTVDIKGNAGATLDAAAGATAATNSLQAGCVYNSSAPAPSSGQQEPCQLDSSGNLKVTLSSLNLPATILSGQQAVTASAVALATNSLTKGICVEGLSSNTISIYVGPSGVTTSTGIEIPPGASYCVGVSNSNALYVIASTTGASVTWSGN